MNKYNAHYFFKNIEKKINNNLIDSEMIVDEIYTFIQGNRSFDYLNSFKELESIINSSKQLKEIDINKIKQNIQKLIGEIENEMSNEEKYYSYIEEKIRQIVFSIK